MKARRHARGHLLALLLAIAPACLTGTCKPSSTYGAPTVPPDESYETGGGHAARVLVWNCTHELRVVMHQSCGEGCTGCGGWTVEQGPCGSPTDYELQLGSNREHHPIPEGNGWR